MSKSIFRKSALDELNSPEQVNELLHITNQRGWLFLSALILAVCSALIWGFFGRVPTRISGQCIFHKKAGVYTVVSQGDGVIESIKRLSPGDEVTKGEVLATVAQPVIRVQLESARKAQAQVEAELALVEEGAAKSISLLKQYQAVKRAEINQGLKAAHILIESLTQTYNAQRSLQSEGIVTTITVQQTRQQLLSAEQKLQELTSDLRQLDNDLANLEISSQQKIQSVEQKLVASANEVDRTLSELSIRSEIASPISGKVIEKKVYRGDKVAINTPIFDVEDETSKVTVSLYLPPYTLVKNVEKGMDVQISPANARREEFGFIRGKVEFVSSFPVTQEGMMSILQYPQLVNEISKSGPPYLVDVSLLQDPESLSGFAWSSKAGNTIHVSAGSMCTGLVKVREVPPISLVFPWLKKLLGLI